MWAHLTDVEITICRPSAVLLLLQLCPNLSSLTIDIAFRHKQLLETLTHTGIQTLHIIHSFFIIDSLSDLFNALSLPNLRILKTPILNAMLHRLLVAFLARSECPLESLTVGGQVKITDVDLVKYVALIPSIDIVDGLTR
jgi:hypothetical protein